MGIINKQHILVFMGIMVFVFLFGCSKTKGIVSEYEPDYSEFRIGSNSPVNDRERMYQFAFQDNSIIPGGGILSYLNAGSGEWQILCWKPNCDHSSSDCPAYYAEGHDILNATLGGCIRILEFANGGHELEIWEINTHKSSKNILASFNLDRLTDGKNKGFNQTLSFCEYRGILYLVYPSSYIGNNGEQQGSLWLIRINLTTLKPEDSICISDIEMPKDYPIIQKIKLIIDDTVYLELADREIGTHEETIALRIFGFDLETNNLRDTGFGIRSDEIYCLMGQQAFSFKQNDNGKKSLLKTDLITGTKTSIKELSGRTSMTVWPGAQYLGYLNFLSVDEIDSSNSGIYQLNPNTMEKMEAKSGSKLCMSYSNGYAAYYEYLEDNINYRLVIEKVIS